MTVPHHGPGDLLVLSCGPGNISTVQALSFVLVDLLTNRVRGSRQESAETVRSRHTNLE
jgi:hypothetical protein